MKQNLGREEIEYIFNLIDEDANNTIELEEFKKWLKDNDVQLSMNHNSYKRQISNAFE